MDVRVEEIKRRFESGEELPEEDTAYLLDVIRQLEYEIEFLRGECDALAV